MLLSIGRWVLLRSRNDLRELDKAMAIKYREDTVIKSHFMSGNKTYPKSGEGALCKILSASDFPVRISSTLCRMSSPVPFKFRKLSLPSGAGRGEVVNVGLDYLLVQVRRLVDHQNILPRILKSLSEYCFDREDQCHSPCECALLWQDERC